MEIFITLSAVLFIVLGTVGIIISVKERSSKDLIVSSILLAVSILLLILGIKSIDYTKKVDSIPIGVTEVTLKYDSVLDESDNEDYKKIVYSLNDNPTKVFIQKEQNEDEVILIFKYENGEVNVVLVNSRVAALAEIVQLK